MDDRGPKRCSCLCAHNHPGERVCDGTAPDAVELKDRVCGPCQAAMGRL
jgi:hypothetical protein